MLLTPQWVTAKNMADTVIKDKWVTVAKLCVSAVQEECSAAGIS